MIEITVNIRTIDDDHGETNMTKTKACGGDNPRFYAREIRQNGPGLLDEMVSRMTALHGDIDDPDRRSK